MWVIYKYGLIYYIYSKAIRIFSRTFKYYCGEYIISASLTVTNLGVLLDRNLTMAYQVSKYVRICTYKLRMVNIIRDKLSVHVAERVVNAMVTGNLDYCNSLLYGITAGQLGRLQKIQNTAARLILRRNRRSSATVMLHELHRLPIKKRVMYKLLLVVYKSQHDMAPDYITAHLQDYTPPRLLRSSEDRQLVGIKNACTLRRYIISGVRG